MKNIIAIFLWVLLCTNVTYAQVSKTSQSISVSELQNQYEVLFAVQSYKHKGESKVILKLAKLSGEHILANFVNRYYEYINYLLISHPINTTPLETQTTDTEKLHQAYIAALKADKGFVADFNEMVYWYLQSEGKTLAGYTSKGRRTITKAELVSMSASFFTPLRIRNDGSIFWAFVRKDRGRTSYLSADKESLLIGAFCKVAVKNTQGYGSDLKAYQAVINANDMIGSEEEKFVLAGKKMHNYMNQNEALATAVMEIYEDYQSILAFEVVDE